MKLPWPFTGLLLVGLSLGLVACSSAPIRFHTLVPPPDKSSTAGNRERIVVESVSVPPQVNRTELVVREEASGLVILESDWWGASLPEEIRSALTARLDGPSTQNPTRAWVTITRFDTLPGRGAWLEADYRLNARQSTDTTTICRFRHQSNAGDSITSLVLAHQENLDALAQEIAQGASRLEQRQTGCP
ncbi:hypothetical protein RE428_16190 [Marinobacter nanhaiticus D15-8W]|uniref:Membrane integrity-associated transporter subunit PqiC n=1 Tax=Marinobacter nanhaiticus D15-8W TaxID=626887 RepID=N6VZE8_9GAMM|nr:PqiC family protein [Marinobacter nanhaiticus]ENO13239.1 membrane integrity-associated transporter subunit PqiC [Marinobacter nanhaiticus D15-8W]BES70601.1 hypothetical protein RE428_16190 [Marinobacter nanhaiticus D15-8W]